MLASAHKDIICVVTFNYHVNTDGICGGCGSNGDFLEVYRRFNMDDRAAACARIGTRDVGCGFQEGPGFPNML